MIKLKDAFTLIELLVVIAIIGILSGLIIVGMSSSVQSATIAKAQVFSTSLRDSLLMNLVSDWKLDDVSGTNVADFWSGGNPGTLYNFTDTTAGYGDANSSGWMSASNCISGTCLKFDGATNYVSFGNRSNLHFSSNFTIEAWVKIPAAQANQDCMILGDYNGGYRGYKFSIDNNRQVYMSVGRLSDTTTSATWTNPIDLNKWYHVVGFYDGKINIFVNGLRAATGPSYAPIEAEVSNIIMGKAQWWAKYFQGSIDNVRVYNTAMPASQIKEQYYAGLNPLLAKGEIILAEYQKRLGELAVLD